MAILKKFVYIVGKIFYISTFAIMGIILLFFLFLFVIIPIANNFIAANVANDIKRLPLPDDTELIDSISIAGNFAGTGNLMEYFGAILIKSELTLEELDEYYSQYKKEKQKYFVESQTDEIINIIRHGQYTFDISNETTPLTDHYIVYAWGYTDSIFSEFDIRSH